MNMIFIVLKLFCTCIEVMPFPQANACKDLGTSQANCVRLPETPKEHIRRPTAAKTPAARQVTGIHRVYLSDRLCDRQTWHVTQDVSLYVCSTCTLYGW